MERWTTQASLWEDVVNEYVRDDCIMELNISERPKEGRVSLLKRVRRKDVVILASDKGKEIVVVTPEAYWEMGRDHIADDTEITWVELQSCPRELTGYARALARVFRLGAALGGEN